jgi:hypothetical protein
LQICISDLEVLAVVHTEHPESGASSEHPRLGRGRLRTPRKALEGATHVGRREEDGDNYESDVAALAASVRVLMDASPVDRHAVIREFDVLSRLVAWKSLEQPDGGEDEHPLQFVDLYGWDVYLLLENGWGREMYSPDGEGDRWDWALLHSLLTVVHATDRALRGADLNKRSYEALAWHALHPVGRQLIDDWLGRFRYYLDLADQRAQEYE